MAQKYHPDTRLDEIMFLRNNNDHVGGIRRKITPEDEIPVFYTLLFNNSDVDVHTFYSFTVVFVNVYALSLGDVQTLHIK